MARLLPTKMVYTGPSPSRPSVITSPPILGKSLAHWVASAIATRTSHSKFGTKAQIFLSGNRGAQDEMSRPRTISPETKEARMFKPWMAAFLKIVLNLAERTLRGPGWIISGSVA
jgi:hypothetical protein